MVQGDVTRAVVGELLIPAEKAPISLSFSGRCETLAPAHHNRSSLKPKLKTKPSRVPKGSSRFGGAAASRSLGCRSAMETWGDPGRPWG